MVRIHSSSGTTGQAVVIYHTREDIEAWADLVARSLYMAGMRRSDVFQNMMGYGLFTGGLGFHYGAERIGGPHHPRRRRQQPPPYSTHAGFLVHRYTHHPLLRPLSVERIRGDGAGPPLDTSLRIAFIGAEPHSEDMRQRIEKPTAWTLSIPTG